MENDEHEGQTKESQGKLATVVSIAEGKRANTQTSGSSAPLLFDIRHAWDIVLPGIEQILEETPQLTFRPEDVYTECREGRAQLYISEKGWAILTREIDHFTDEHTLLIWLAKSVNPGDHSWVYHKEWLFELAREQQCEYIEARSAIKELEPYAEATGWIVDTRVFRLEVEYDGRES